MAVKLLIIDTDDDWLKKAKSYFIEHLYEVKVVKTSEEAKLALFSDNFYSIILNYEIQKSSNNELLTFIKSTYGHQRVIVVVNNKSLVSKDAVNSEQVIKWGGLGMIVKPFTFEDLENSFEVHQGLDCLKPIKADTEEVSDENIINQHDDLFSKIKIDEFYSSRAVMFDVFIKLGSGRYLKILHTGDTLSKDRLDKYKNEKKVKNLHFLKTDRHKFIQYYNVLAKEMLENKKIEAINKVNVLRNITEQFIEESYTEGIKPEVVKQGMEICESVYTLLASQDDLFKVLKSYQNFDPNAFSHAFLVTLYASAIARQFEWQNKWTVEATALASMFHDVGKILLPKHFIDLLPNQMTDDEYEQYKKHPELGLRLVEGNHLISNSIKQVILQHHEYYDGTGFPTGKKGNKIAALANIVCLADDFVHVMFEHKLSPTDALKLILMNSEMSKRYNSVILEKLIYVFADTSKFMRGAEVVTTAQSLKHKKVS